MLFIDNVLIFSNRLEIQKDISMVNHIISGGAKLIKLNTVIAGVQGTRNKYFMIQYLRKFIIS